MFDLVIPSTQTKPIFYLMAGPLCALILGGFAQVSVSLPQGSKQAVPPLQTTMPSMVFIEKVGQEAELRRQL